MSHLFVMKKMNQENVTKSFVSENQSYLCPVFDKACFIKCSRSSSKIQYSSEHQYCHLQPSITSIAKKFKSKNHGLFFKKQFHILILLWKLRPKKFKWVKTHRQVRGLKEPTNVGIQKPAPYIIIFVIKHELWNTNKKCQ